MKNTSADSASFLIVPAFAKCGTTLLHSVFETIPGVSTPKDTKEIKYFITDSPNLEDYLDCFPGEVSDPDIYFESSPPYFSGRSIDQCRKVCANIQSTLDDPHILICLRQPIARAFSHYIHDLQAFSRWGRRQHKAADDPNAVFNNPAKASFYDSIKNYSNISDLYFEKLKLCIDIFGAERCSFFFLEYDAEYFMEFGQRLARDLGMKEFKDWPKQSPRVLESYACPQYFLGGEEIETRESRRFVLPEGKVLVSTSFGSQLLDSPDPQKAHELFQTQKTWTNVLTTYDAEKIYNSHFKEDFDKTLSLLESCYADKYKDQIRFYREFTFKEKALPKAKPRSKFMQDMGFEEV